MNLMRQTLILLGLIIIGCQQAQPEQQEPTYYCQQTGDIERYYDTSDSTLAFTYDPAPEEGEEYYWKVAEDHLAVYTVSMGDGTKIKRYYVADLYSEQPAVHFDADNPADTAMILLAEEQVRELRRIRVKFGEKANKDKR